MAEGAGKRPRGRPAVYLDAADRQAAHRERQAIALARGAATAAIMERPSLPFIKLMIRLALDQAADPAEVRAELVAYLAAAPAGSPTV